MESIIAAGVISGQHVCVRALAKSSWSGHTKLAISCTDQLIRVIKQQRLIHIDRIAQRLTKCFMIGIKIHSHAQHLPLHLNYTIFIYGQIR